MSDNDIFDRMLSEDAIEYLFGDISIGVNMQMCPTLRDGVAIQRGLQVPFMVSHPSRITAPSEETISQISEQLTAMGYCPEYIELAGKSYKVA